MLNLTVCHSIRVLHFVTVLLGCMSVHPGTWSIFYVCVVLFCTPNIVLIAMGGCEHAHVSMHGLMYIGMCHDADADAENAHRPRGVVKLLSLWGFVLCLFVSHHAYEKIVQPCSLLTWIA